MALQINGTTVVDNSRNVTNVGSGTFSGKVTSQATSSSDGSTTLATKGYVDSQEAGAINDIFWENSQTVSSNYTISSGKNALSAGPITIANGVTVTVPSGSAWAVL